MDPETIANAGPEKAYRPFAVGPNGRVVFHSSYAPGDPTFTVIDTSGQVVAEFGREGQGPGELRMVFWLAIRDSAVWAFDPSQFRLSAFTVGGRHIDDHRLPDATIIADVFDQSAFLFRSPDLRRPELVRVSLEGGDLDVLIPSSDSTLQALGQQATNWSQHVGVAVGSAGVTVASGYDYGIFRPRARRLVEVANPDVPARTRSPSEVEEAARRLREAAERGQRNQARVEDQIAGLSEEVLPHFRGTGVHR